VETAVGVGLLSLCYVWQMTLVRLLLWTVYLCSGHVKYFLKTQHFPLTKKRVTDLNLFAFVFIWSVLAVLRFVLWKEAYITESMLQSVCVCACVCVCDELYVGFICPGELRRWAKVYSLVLFAVVYFSSRKAPPLPRYLLAMTAYVGFDGGDRCKFPLHTQSNSN